MPRPSRRRFTAEYKLRILQEAERCAPGELGALLRREGLYSSHLATWRKQRRAGSLAGLAAKKRGPKVDPLAEELARLKRENAQLQAKLKWADLIIDAQKSCGMLQWVLDAKSENIVWLAGVAPPIFAGCGRAYLHLLGEG